MLGCLFLLAILRRTTRNGTLDPEHQGLKARKQKQDDRDCLEVIEASILGALFAFIVDLEPAHKHDKGSEEEPGEDEVNTFFMVFELLLAY